MSGERGISVEDAVGEVVGGARCCLACGYDLQGLGEEPRCPECGLLNIPEGYRRQVQELVDSGKWFFSSFFGVFRKRPPGWWWSLDRPGDVKRAAHRALSSLAIAFLIIFAAGALTGSVTYTRDATFVAPPRVSATDPRRVDVNVMRGIVSYRLAYPASDAKFENSQLVNVSKNDVPKSTAIVRQEIDFSWTFLGVCSIGCGGILLVWSYPACVGIWTQIRRSLPPFARARRTILAASLHECHRLVFSAFIVALLLALDAIFRWNGYQPKPRLMMSLRTWAGLCALIFAALGWIGPLRSDYTRQLVQSRGHAARIFLMYAVAFPAITVFAVVALIATIKAGY